MTSTRLPCGLNEADRLDYVDGALSGIFGEYVAAHVAHCPACQAWQADYDKIGRLLRGSIQPPDEPWRRAQFTERLVEEMRKEARPRRPRLWLSMFAGVALLLLLSLLPLTTQGGQFLDGVVQFGKVPTRSTIPPDQQRNLLHTLDFTQHPGATPQITPVAPLDLPAGLTLTKHKIADDGHIELLYQDGDQTTLLVSEYKQRPGLLRTELTPHEQFVMVGGIQVLIFDDPRPGAVAALSWIRHGVFFDVLILAAPHGNDGGFKDETAIAIVRTIATQQDQ